MSKIAVRLAVNDMRGRKISDITRHGKVLFFKLSPRHGSGQAGQPKRVMAIHLRMSGRLEVVKGTNGTKESKGANDHPAERLDGLEWVHFRWRLSPRRGSGQAGGRELRFIDPRKFGIVWYGSPEDLVQDPYLGRLGQDARTMTWAGFSRALANGRGMIKPYLLRQDRFAGIGNIIADESLWQARIHPEAHITSLDTRAVGVLHRGIQRTIHAMLASGGTSIRDWGHPDGGRGTYQHQRLIYGRAGQRCPRCRTTLIRLVVGGRGTTVCPSCQPRRIVGNV